MNVVLPLFTLSDFGSALNIRKNKVLPILFHPGVYSPLGERRHKKCIHMQRTELGKKLSGG